MTDLRPWLYERLANPPEPEGWDYSPGAEAERAFYDAEEGHPCPVCHSPKGSPSLGCWLCYGDFGPRSRNATYPDNHVNPWEEQA